jgi:hypothetical protein
LDTCLGHSPAAIPNLRLNVNFSGEGLAIHGCPCVIDTFGWIALHALRVAILLAVEVIDGEWNERVAAAASKRNRAVLTFWN